jgi:hypothetical protein
MVEGSNLEMAAYNCLEMKQHKAVAAQWYNCCLTIPRTRVQVLPPLATGEKTAKNKSFLPFFSLQGPML